MNLLKWVIPWSAYGWGGNQSQVQSDKRYRLLSINLLRTWYVNLSSQLYDLKSGSNCSNQLFSEELQMFFRTFFP